MGKSRKYERHGMSSTKLHNVYRQMMSRCYNRNHRSWPGYGGRGIKVCKRWHSFINFFNDMGHPPKESPTLDRIDNNKGYSPSNCRWASWRVQANNKRRTIPLVVDGAPRSISEMADALGLRYNILYERLRRGISIEDATDPEFKYKRGRRFNSVSVGRFPRGS